MASVINSRWNTLVGYKPEDLISGSLTITTTKNSSIFARMWVHLFGGGLKKSTVAGSIHTFLLKPETQAFLRTRSPQELHEVKCNLSALRQRFSAHSDTSNETTSASRACASLTEAMRVISNIHKEATTPVKTVEAMNFAEEVGVEIVEAPIVEKSPAELRAVERQFERCLTTLVQAAQAYGIEGYNLAKQALLLAIPEIFGTTSAEVGTMYLNLFRKFFYSRSSTKAGWDPSVQMDMVLMKYPHRNIEISPVHADRMQQVATGFVRILGEVEAATKAKKREAAEEIKALSARQAKILEEMRAQSSTVVGEDDLLQAEQDTDALLGAFKARLAALDSEYTQIEAQKAKLQAQIKEPKKSFFGDALSRVFGILSLQDRMNVFCLFV